MNKAVSKAGMTVEVSGEHRTGFCEDCETKTEVKNVSIGRRIKPVAACPKCGGKGKLIAKTIIVTPPELPQCSKPHCLVKYLWDSLFAALLATYHTKRVAYAEKNRHKEILPRYRTGDPAPKNMWEAIHANIKLTCPVCRKYNADPLLGSNLYKEV